jgi:hypothetical protein
VRLIGGRDYYDGAGMGFDPTIMFVRTAPEELRGHPFPVHFPVPTKHSPWRMGGDSHEPHICFFKVFIAGELYPTGSTRSSTTMRPALSRSSINRDGRTFVVSGCHAARQSVNTSTSPAKARGRSG